MAKLNPPPQNTKQTGFIESLARSVFQIFSALGGGSGIPNIFGVEGTPGSDPGWSTSSTTNMTPPDGYLELYNKDGDLVEVPYWNK